MEPRIVRFCAANVTPPVLIQNVPALVCRRCGGEVFADEVVEVFEFVRDSRVPTLARQPLIRAYDYRQEKEGLENLLARLDAGGFGLGLGQAEDGDGVREVKAWREEQQ